MGLGCEGTDHVGASFTYIYFATHTSHNLKHVLHLDMRLRMMPRAARQGNASTDAVQLLDWPTLYQITDLAPIHSTGTLRIDV